MRQREKWQHAAGWREGVLDSGCGRTKITTQGAVPDFRIGVGVVTQPSPKTVGIEIFFEVISRRERRVGISTTTTSLTAASAAFEMKRLAPFNSRRATEGGIAAITGEGCGIAVEQKALRARPNPKYHVPGAVLGQRVGIAITGEFTVADQNAGAGVCERTFRRHFQFTDRRLMIRQAEMFTAIFRRDDDGLAGGEGELQCFRRHVFCVHVDLHAAAALRDGLELGPPEIFLAARDPALTMDAESDAGDRWNFFEQQGQSLATIGRVG